jgi:hypothetical protein
MKPLSAALSSVLLAGTTFGCISEGPPNPVPVDTAEIPDAVPTGDARRAVERRSPLGATTGNLLVDGDFELSIILEGTGAQSGWLAFSGSNYLRGETGGLCRSGLRCGWLDPGVLLFGQGAAAKDSGMIATVWVRPNEGRPCNAVTASLLRCNSFQSAARLMPETELPGSDGWCLLRGRASQQSSAVCMLIEGNSVLPESALIDDAAIVPDKGNVALSSQGVPDVSFTPLTGERRAKVQALLEWRRQRMKFGTPLQDRPNLGDR